MNSDIAINRNNMSSSENKKKKNRKRKHYAVPFVKKEDSCGLPPEVAAVFAEGQRKIDDNAKNKIQQFATEIHDIKRGKKLFNLSPAHIRDLQFGYYARRKALESILGAEKYVSLGIPELKYAQLITLSDYLYRQLCIGLGVMLKKLDINTFISVEKIIKAGNSIKNYDGTEIYGGNTVRDFIRYNARNEKTSAEKVNKDVIKTVIKGKENMLTDYRRVKSLPFSLFSYRNGVAVKEDGSIYIPDIEAKKNLKIILGEDYDSNMFTGLTLIEATAYESRLIHVIKKTVSREIEQFLKEYDGKLAALPEIMRKDIIAAGDVSLISSATKKCLIHEVVTRYMDNFRIMAGIWESAEDRLLTDEEKNALFQIEYQAARKNPDIDFEYIADFGAYLKDNPVKKSEIENLLVLYMISGAAKKDGE